MFSVDGPDSVHAHASFRVQGLVLSVSGFGFRILGLGFRQGLESRV